MAGKLSELKRNRIYRTLVNQGLMVRVVDIYHEDEQLVVRVEVTRSGGVTMHDIQPYEKLLQQMNNWDMFELPVITPDPTH
jgi:hypothetical protein